MLVTEVGLVEQAAQQLLITIVAEVEQAVTQELEVMEVGTLEVEIQQEAIQLLDLAVAEVEQALTVTLQQVAEVAYLFMEKEAME